jgi:hypothetical protein
MPRFFILACTVAATHALSKKHTTHPPLPRGSVGGTCDASIPGSWTGFLGKFALQDSYELIWRGPSFPAGAFSSTYVSGPGGWGLGAGQLSADNRTAVIAFDTGVVLHGNLSDDCTLFSFDNGSFWRKSLKKKVHVVAMNHLDVGYNGIPEVGLINNILNRYFGIYFPRAVALAAAMRALNGTDRFIYTTHPWLLDLYLDCPINFSLSNITLVCPSAADVGAMEEALRVGDVAFHAAPFNIQYGGAFSQAMLDAIFTAPQRLAAKLGLPPPRVASLRDVPGAPRSLVAGLARNGIQVLSIGVNDYAPSPQIPTPTLWCEPTTHDCIVLLMTGQGVGYPDNVGPSPEEPAGLAPRSCAQHPSSPVVLCWAFRTDNSGPPMSVAEVENDLTIARWQWPGSIVVASTFDAWWEEFSPAVPFLPNSTQEAGETWITGFAADPVKNAVFRASAREYGACVAEGACDLASSKPLQDFTRMLMKMPEHTWGMPSLPDHAHYVNSDFRAHRASGDYANEEASWSEQRAFADYAVAALGDHPLAARVRAAVAAVVPPPAPSPANGPGPGFSRVADPASASWALSTAAGAVEIALDAATGAIGRLSVGGTALADAAHPLAALEYVTVNDTDLNAQHVNTVPDNESCCCCYGWQFMQAVAAPESSRTWAAVSSVWASSASATPSPPFSLLVDVAFPPDKTAKYGAPSDVWVNYTVTPEGSVRVAVAVYGKQPTRLGEALFLHFATPGSAAGRWFADVLELLTDPLSVVERGSVHQHGCGAGVSYVDVASGAGVAVDSMDVPVFSPVTPSNPAMTMIVPYSPLKEPVTAFAAVLFSNIYNVRAPPSPPPPPHTPSNRPTLPSPADKLPSLLG